MFLDSWKSKLKMLLIPFFLWVGAGIVAEALAVLLLYTAGGSAVKSENFYGLLSIVHAQYNTELLLARNLLALPFLILAFRKDSARIGASLPEFRPYLERSRFFTEEEHLKGTDPRNLLFLLPGAFYAVAANLILVLTGLLKADAQEAQSSGRGIAGLLLLIAFEVIAAPVLEELLCRGLIYRRLRTYAGVLLSAFVSAVMFAAFHWDPVQSIYAFFFGWILADLFELSGSLIAVILTHAAANAAALLMTECAPVQAFLLAYKVPCAILAGILLFASPFLISRLCGKTSPAEEEPGSSEAEARNSGS